MFTNNVKDAVEATLHLGFTSAAAGLFNIGSGRASTWIELVTPIFEELGLPVALDFIDLPESLRHKYQYYTCADLTRSDGGMARPTVLSNALCEAMSAGTSCMGLGWTRDEGGFGGGND